MLINYLIAAIDRVLINEMIGFGSMQRLQRQEEEEEEEEEEERAARG